MTVQIPTPAPAYPHTLPETTTYDGSNSTARTIRPHTKPLLLPLVWEKNPPDTHLKTTTNGCGRNDLTRMVLVTPTSDRSRCLEAQGQRRRIDVHSLDTERQSKHKNSVPRKDGSKPLSRCSVSIGFCQGEPDMTRTNVRIYPLVLDHVELSPDAVSPVR